jgi:hypothetical protein
MKPSLPPQIAAFACLDFISRAEAAAKVIGVSTLANEPGSPGRVFKLSEPELADLLERACAETPDLELTSSAGAPQLIYHGTLEDVAASALYVYYQGRLGKGTQSLPIVAGYEADGAEDPLKNQELSA